jgi:hypothetical protein
MNWIFDHNGQWQASSKAKAGFMYRVSVCEDGTFDISRSDHGLVRSVDQFQRLRNAQLFCETEEKVHSFEEELNGA